MNGPDPISSGDFAGFAVLPWLTWLLIAWSLRGAGGARLSRIPWIAMAWLAVTGVLAAAGFFADWQRTPPPFLLFVLAQFVALLVAVRVAARPADLVGVSQAWLVGLQAFRIPTELLMSSLGGHGLLPVEMTFHGRNFDVVSGALGVILALVVARRGEARSRGLLLAYNVLGLVLVTAVVAQGLLSAPTPLQKLHLSIPNIHLVRFPLCWLPLGLVPAAYFLHFLSLRKLRATTAELPR